jgi:hypothetical protein
MVPDVYKKPAASFLKDFIMKKKAFFFETAAKTHPMTQRHTPEDLSP